MRDGFEAFVSEVGVELKKQDNVFAYPSNSSPTEFILLLEDFRKSIKSREQEREYHKKIVMRSFYNALCCQVERDIIDMRIIARDIEDFIKPVEYNAANLEKYFGRMFNYRFGNSMLFEVNPIKCQIVDLTKKCELSCVLKFNTEDEVKESQAFSVAYNFTPVIGYKSMKCKIDVPLLNDFEKQYDWGTIDINELIESVQINKTSFSKMNGLVCQITLFTKEIGDFEKQEYTVSLAIRADIQHSENKLARLDLDSILRIELMEKCNGRRSQQQVRVACRRKKIGAEVSNKSNILTYKIYLKDGRIINKKVKVGSVMHKRLSKYSEILDNKALKNVRR